MLPFTFAGFEIQLIASSESLLTITTRALTPRSVCLSYPITFRLIFIIDLTTLTKGSALFYHVYGSSTSFRMCGSSTYFLRWPGDTRMSARLYEQERAIHMALALRNKQLLALIIVALITVAVIAFLVLGMASHLSLFHQNAWQPPAGP